MRERKRSRVHQNLPEALRIIDSTKRSRLHEPATGKCRDLTINLWPGCKISILRNKSMSPKSNKVPNDKNESGPQKSQELA